MNKILVLVVMLFTPILLAASNDLSHWNFDAQGEGSFKLNARKGECGLVFFDLRVNEARNELVLFKGGYSCGQISGEYPYSVFKVRDNLLYQNKKVVGEFDANLLTIHSETDGFKLDLIRSKNKYFYHERWDDGFDQFEVKALLHD